MDFAKRAHDHQYRLDPIVRSLLDTDFYKLLMMQFIWKHYRDVPATFALKNRTKTVYLGTMVHESEIREQLDFVKRLRFTNSELVWLAGNTFYGQDRIFNPMFIEYLRDEFQLPNYTLELERDPTLPSHGFQDTPTGQWKLEFKGTWLEVTLWEIYALAIVNELRNRKLMEGMSKLELDIMYAQAKTKVWNKFKKLNTLPELNLTDFGTRRRHSFLWQEWVVLAAAKSLNHKFTGTSNAYLAYKHGLEAKGTNAHELPMVLATLCETDGDLRLSQYEVLRQWQEMYPQPLWIALPDTFGTVQFLKDAPEWFDDWSGIRVDSMDPVEAAHLLEDFWISRSQDPKKKLTLFSDGLDVDQIYSLQHVFGDKLRLGFGWGTMLTNDFIGCHPTDPDRLKPISLVCKVKEANHKPAVKLSDNLEKATGTPEEIARYKRAFGYTETYTKETKV